MDWEDFAGRLTRELTRLTDGAFLIVQGPSGLPYVQAMRAGESFDAEAVGSAFLPRPLSARQERRLAALGWQEPDGRDMRNWTFRFELPGRRRDFQYTAGRMVAAFRDVYGVRSPLELVYQAGRSGPGGGGLALPGLGIPMAIPEAEGEAPPAAPAGPDPGADLEGALGAARERGDQRAYLELLGRATLFLPDAGGLDANGVQQYATARFGDGTFVLAFTSPEAMRHSLRGQAARHRAVAPAELARVWPHPEWQLAINPGLPSAAYLEAHTLLPAGQSPPARPPAPPSPPPAPQAPPPTPQAPTPTPAPQAPPPAPKAPPSAPPSPPPVPQARPRTRPKPPPTDFVVMQKVLRPEHVQHYLKGGYDRVAGYVHRLVDVQDLTTPAKLVRGLGLVYEGAPFDAADETVHVVRWPAVKPALFRTPLGGIDEWSMSIIPGGWVIEKAPFPGSGYAPGEGAAIPEFKINTQRLPHGAEIHRVCRDGTVALVAVYDADRGAWRPPAPGGRG
ncbi:SseB family protein [Actinomadura macrotermitis]|uniref:SseB protein N-terminal domain-containing protein n=1 Tax=Actinomadura macrotermitis TaxID=2585200 RepID=A0A7K0C4I5_9ACTN|nr:SseB family protein [Actinomadura macrotermitis]MQY08350.1 hypothetical protein [Actinomadura macrotermitis]